MEISVVISTFSRERLNYVLSCIESLKNQTFSPKEIILVLDPDETLLEFYKSRLPSDVKVAISEDYGLSCARNTGVKNSDADIIAFIDDDAFADANWLRNMVKNYDDPRVVGVGGFVKPVWEHSRPVWFPEELDWIVGCSYKGLPQKKATVRNPIGCNMSFRRTVFQKIGFFRNDIGRVGNKLTAHEDTELGIRIA